MDVYPEPGLVTAMLTMWPPLIAAVPINSRIGVPVEEDATATLTVVWIPLLYPEPLLPIEIAETVPPAEIVTVAPAATRGW